MITKQTIAELYKKYRRCPKNLEDRNLSLLIEYALDTDAVELDGDMLVFTNMEDYSLFKRIELGRIHCVVDFDETVAVVLPNSIIFIRKTDYSTFVHIKENPRGICGKIRYMFEK